MLSILRTDSDNADFISLVKLLDEDLAVRDGTDHAFYAEYNKTNHIRQTIVVYHDNSAAGCGAIKAFEPGSMEVKRMYVLPTMRGKGIATKILTALERWAAELGNSRCVLETGKRQPEAIALYLKNGYRVIPNYGQYRGMENSVCFEKTLVPGSV